jgi:acetylglutamate kinase
MEINKDIVETLTKLGGKAEGLSCTDGIIAAGKHILKIERGGVREEIDLGFVGEVVNINPAPIKDLCRKNVIPVIAPLGVDDEGRVYNINADTVAGEIAAALKARKLVLLTDVRGILREPGDEQSLLGTIRIDDIAELIAAGVIRDGMLPKIKAALKSVTSGVNKTHVIDGRVPHSILLEIFTDRGIGTEIVR